MALRRRHFVGVDEVVRVLRDIFRAQYGALLALREEGRIDNTVMRRLRSDLDDEALSSSAASSGVKLR